jgi:hypothetical protein
MSDGGGEAQRARVVPNRVWDEVAKDSTPVENRQTIALSISTRYFIIVLAFGFDIDRLAVSIQSVDMDIDSCCSCR